MLKSTLMKSLDSIECQFPSFQIKDLIGSEHYFSSLDRWIDEMDYLDLGRFVKGLYNGVRGIMRQAFTINGSCYNNSYHNNIQMGSLDVL